MSSVELLDSCQALLKVKGVSVVVKYRLGGVSAVSRRGAPFHRFDAMDGLLQLTERLPQTMRGVAPKGGANVRCLDAFMAGAKDRYGERRERGEDGKGQHGGASNCRRCGCYACTKVAVRA